MKRKLLDYGYLASSLAGAALIALNLGTQVLGFTLFLVSNILGVVLLKGSTASKSLILVNVVFALINVVGIVRYLQ